MRRLNKQSGFSAVEVVVIIVVVAIISFLGYTFYTNYMNKSTNESSTSSNKSIKAPAITSSEDLDEASAAMDDTQLDESNADDLSELDGTISEL